MQLPRLAKIRQHFDGPAVEDIEGEVRRQMQRVVSSVSPGMKVAITAGSRGIAHIALIIRTMVRELKRAGAEPRIIPAMGSHGGATADGQIEVLNGLGITEHYCEAPILSSMAVTQIGVTNGGIPVYADTILCQAMV